MVTSFHRDSFASQIVQVTDIAKAIRIDRQSVALRQTLDQQQIDLLEARLNDPRPYAKKYSAVEAAVAKADRQEKLDLLEEFKSEDFKGLPRP